MKRISVVEASHRFARDVVREGDLAIDATAGNGLDTLLLCELVGAGGRVLSIDVQAPAIDRTGRVLTKSGLADRCILVEADHAHLAAIAVEHAPGIEPRIVMLNLGYLPGGDKTVVTRGDSTRLVLAAAAELVCAGGGVSVVVYRGHKGGPDESDVVQDWISRLDPLTFQVRSEGFEGYPEHRPYFVAIRRID